MVEASWEGSGPAGSACKGRGGAVQFPRCRREPTEWLFLLCPPVCSRFHGRRKARGCICCLHPQYLLYIQDNCAFSEDIEQVIAGKDQAAGLLWSAVCGAGQGGVRGVGTGVGENVSWLYLCVPRQVSASLLLGVTVTECVCIPLFLLSVRDSDPGASWAPLPVLASLLWAGLPWALEDFDPTWGPQ